MNGPTRPTLYCPCSSAVEHSLGKGKASSSILYKGIAQSPTTTGDSKNLESKNILKINLRVCTIQTQGWSQILYHKRIVQQVLNLNMLNHNLNLIKEGLNDNPRDYS